MRRSWMVAMCGLLCWGLGAAAQTPPANARDITQMPVTTATGAAVATAPTTMIAAPASVLRVFVDTLSGTDANAVSGLIVQALFASKQVVVTENQSNASLILKGTVLRQAVPALVPARKRGSRGAAGPGRLGAADATTDLQDAALADLAPLPGLDAPTDLSQYRYRLNLEAVNPSGDLVWMSGRGSAALGYAEAQSAVEQTLQPLLAAVAQWQTAAGSGKPQ